MGAFFNLPPLKHLQQRTVRQDINLYPDRSVSMHLSLSLSPISITHTHLDDLYPKVLVTTQRWIAKRFAVERHAMVECSIKPDGGSLTAPTHPSDSATERQKRESSGD
jgi:hypothetical protein